MANNIDVSKVKWDTEPIDVSKVKGDAPQRTGQATPQAEFRQGPSKTAQTLSSIARPVLTGLGAGLGGVAGAALTPELLGVGAVPGAGLGYATGNKIADAIDRGLGVSRGAPDLKSATLSTLKDLGTGVMMEMGGQLGGKLINSGVAALARRGGAPYSAGASRVKAGNVLENVYGNPTVRETSNAAKVAKIRKRTGVRQPLTTAQQTGSTKAAAFEQSMAAKSDLMESLSTQDTGARETALNGVKRSLGQGRPLPGASDPQAVGANISGSINSALEPVKAAEKVIWGEVPSYPMPNIGLQSAISKVASEPYEKPVQDAIDNTLAYIKQIPKNTEGMRAIDRTLSNNISKALRSGDNNLARVYQNMKAGVSSDFRAMSDAINAGDVALHNGTVVFPSRLRAELAEVNTSLASRQVGASQPGLLQRKAEIEGILNSNLQPADDIAGAYRAAKDFSRQKFERFDRGATSKVLAKGNEIEGQRLPYEQIPSRFYNPSGASDLVRAVGQKQAAEQMRPHVINDLLAKTAPNGEMSVIQAERYLKKNIHTLRKLGLEAEVQGIVKGQIPKEFERMLATKRVDRLTDNPYFTTQEAGKLLREYAPIIKKYYGNDAVQSLRDYHGLMKALSRNKSVTYSGGSNTWEKFVNTPEEMIPVGRKVTSAVLNVMATALGAGGGAVVSGATGAITGAAVVGSGRAIAGALSENAKLQTAKLLRDAIVDPAKAKALMQIARSANDKAATITASKVLGRWLTGIAGAGGGALRSEENRDAEE